MSDARRGTQEERQEHRGIGLSSFSVEQLKPFYLWLKAVTDGNILGSKFEKATQRTKTRACKATARK